MTFGGLCSTLDSHELKKSIPWPPPQGVHTYASAGVLIYNEHGVLLTHENGKFTTFRGKKDPSDTDYFITAEREFKEENSRLNILINYGVLTTGFDAPKANLAIIARPTQSVSLYSQMVGRVMRGKEAGGKKFFLKSIQVREMIIL